MRKFAFALLLIFGVAAVGVAQSGRQQQPPPPQQQARPRVAPAASPTPQRPAASANAPVTTQNPAQAAKSETPQNSSTDKAEIVNEENDILRVETNLVTIPVSVFDRNGRFVSGLRQEDFKIFEDGKEQEVGYFGTTEQTATVVLVLDTSPSTELRIEEIQNAAISFVNQLKPTDQVMVIEFDENLHVLSELTNDRAKLAKAIKKADFGDGTSLYDTIDNILAKRLKKIEGRKAVVMFTDGVDTTSYKADYYSTLLLAEESEAPIYTIYYNTINDNNDGGGLMTSPLPPGISLPGQFPGIGGQSRPLGTSPLDYARGRRYLEDITDKSGGRLYNTEENRNLEETFAYVAEELKRQYNIGYYPTEAGQKGQRKLLKVRVERPGTVVRARESYIVGEDPQKPETAAAGKQPKRKS
jgi:Ca-activated chloride channel homolog